MTPLKVYFGDLTHDSIILVSDTIPINIGFIAGYAKKLFDSDIDVSLFKYPQHILDAIRADPPDVLALSNYSWNSNLSEFVAGRAKMANPDVITVQGGTNFPHQPSQQAVYLTDRPATDFHTVFEGEVAFANLLRRILETRDKGIGLYDAPVEGTVFIHPSTRGSDVPTLVTSDQPSRIRNLDDIPSPYLSGMMEEFFTDGRLTPFLETNRGCPFKCTFCHTGADYFQKINMFSTDRIRDEINYIARRASDKGIVNLHLADTNFGMYPRDREVCEALYQTHKDFGWPQQIMSTTGKNNKERVIDITGILGNIFAVTMSVQSMDDTVLSNIKRSNIKLDHYIDVNKHLQKKGRSTNAELIIGLPGETRESFFRGVEECIEAGVSSATIYTLMLLNGTEFQSPAYRKTHGIKGKFRILPLNFGEYDEDRVFDFEEVGVETNTMSFDDYLYLRGFALLVETVHNGHIFEEFFRFALSMGTSRGQFLRQLYDNLEDAPETVRSIVDGFMGETRSELWDTAEDLIQHYQQENNYKRLINGEVGGNLIYKYKSIGVARAAREWIEYLTQESRKVALQSLSAKENTDEVESEIHCIGDFCQNKSHGLLDASADVAPRECSYSYDIVEWLTAEEGTQLKKFARSAPVKYVFSYDDTQLRTRDDLFKRYGTDVNALSKIVTRVTSLESLFRKIITTDGEGGVLENANVDRFTRYAQSH